MSILITEERPSTPKIKSKKISARFVLATVSTKAGLGLSRAGTRLAAVDRHYEFGILQVEKDREKAVPNGSSNLTTVTKKLT